MAVAGLGYDPIISPSTRLGVVHLTVQDLSRATAFYCDRIGLRIHRKEIGFVALGAGAEDLLHVTENPTAPRPVQTAGLYHFCLKVDDRRDFARLLGHLVATRTQLAGLVDHRFAEAIYLDDPEGNGVELNWDRPRSEWPDPSIVIRLGNGPLDVEGLRQLAADAPPWNGLPIDASVGHIHLHVGDLTTAEAFYTGVIGFGRVMEMPRQAVFTSAGGYHHHVAMNIWNGRNVPPKPIDGAGLRTYTIVVPSETDRTHLINRAAVAGVAVEYTGTDPLLRDPDGNAIIVAVG